MNNIDDKEVGVKKREFIGRKLKFFDDDDSIAKTEDNKVLTDKQLNKTPWSDTKMKKYGFTNREYNGREIIFKDDIDSVLKKEYDKVPPNIGRDTWASILSKKYIGISRRRM